MKTLTRSILAVAMTAGMSITAAAIADDMPADAGSKMKTMDSNSDGKVSAAEHALGAKKMFESMDANKDGFVTADEMDKAHAGAPKDPKMMSSSDKIKAIDTNGDGKLSAEEHAAGSADMFKKMDTNGDGFISADEMQAGHDAMMKKN